MREESELRASRIIKHKMKRKRIICFIIKFSIKRGGELVKAQNEKKEHLISSQLAIYSSGERWTTYVLSSELTLDD